MAKNQFECSPEQDKQVHQESDDPIHPVRMAVQVTKENRWSEGTDIGVRCWPQPPTRRDKPTVNQSNCKTQFY